MRAAIRMVNLGMPIKAGDGTSSAIPFPSTPNVAQAFFARVGPRSGPPVFFASPHQRRCNVAGLVSPFRGARPAIGSH